MSALDDLNPRQRRFVELVATGMAAGRAYEQAGYSARGDKADQSASRLSRNAKVCEALAEVQASTTKIADAAERQQFWTDVMRGVGNPDMSHRLKASELLARKGGDFIERRDVNLSSDGLQVLVTVPDNSRSGG
jgi:hypothetical protein